MTSRVHGVRHGGCPADGLVAMRNAAVNEKRNIAVEYGNACMKPRTRISELAERFLFLRDASWVPDEQQTGDEKDDGQ